MVGQNIFRHIEPEPGHLGQHRALFTDLIAKNHVKTADTVSGYHNQGVAVVINLTYLALLDGLKFLYAHFSSPYYGNVCTVPD